MAGPYSDIHRIWPSWISGMSIENDMIQLERDLLLAALGARLFSFLRPARNHVSGM